MPFHLSKKERGPERATQTVLPCVALSDPMSRSSCVVEKVAANMQAPVKMFVYLFHKELGNVSDQITL